MSRFPSISLCVPLAVVAGCVERTMQIDTYPAGALVYANDQEIGRTPLRRDFVWYGDYDIVVRKEGYETLKTNQWVVAPWWQWPPFDLFSELLPFRLHDKQKSYFTLEPASTQPADAGQMLLRGAQMQQMLESSKRPRSSASATRP